MVRLIIIGNGFDLTHRRKTTYKDFFLHLLLQKMQEVRSKTPLTPGASKLEVKINDWLTVNLRNPTVFNFETVYSLHLLLKNRDIDINPEGIYTVLKMAESIENWSDVEYQYYDLLGKCKSRSEIKKLNDSLEKFKEEFDNYLTNSVACHQNQFHFSEIADLFFKNYEEEENKIEKWIFLNFNYTDTLETYIKKSQFYFPSRKIIHVKIHGSLVEGNTVFGYGDEHASQYKSWEESNDDEYLRFSKSTRYALNDSYKNLLAAINGTPYQVLIVGHSCGVTDRTLLKELLDNDYCQKIFVCHHNGEESFLSTSYGLFRQFDNKVNLRHKLQDFDWKFALPKAPSKIVLHEAKYGVHGKYLDVKNQIPLDKEFLVSNDLVSKDPAEMQEKHLLLKFTDENGVDKKFRIEEGMTFAF